MTDPPGRPIPDRQPQPSKGTLLVADDDAMFREALCRLLRRQGYVCLTAADSSAALAMLREHEVDALISDIDMPGNMRLELVQTIPQVRRGLPIILLTGQPAFETAAQSVRLSVAAYLVKPPDLGELLAVLEENLARYRSLRTVVSSRERLEGWLRELAVLEEGLRQPSPNIRRTSDYLRLTLSNLAVQLAELARAASPAAPMEKAADEMEKTALVGALQEAVAVLQRTRKSFKSKELGELRKRLEAQLEQTTAVPPSPEPPSARANNPDHS